MKKIIALLLLLFTTLSLAEINPTSRDQDTWANWESRLKRAFENITPRKIPGRAMGILVPQDTRNDLLPLSAIAYEVLARETLRTVVILLPAPASYPLDGIVMPNIDTIESSIGSFTVDLALAAEFRDDNLPIYSDAAPFYPQVPPILENQLALLKFILKGNIHKVKILPIFVHFKDLNSQVKDLGPALADQLKDANLISDVSFIIAADLTQALTEDKLIPTDSTYLNAIRNLDVDTLIELSDLSKVDNSLFKMPNVDPVALGLLLMKFIGGDHGEILAYAHSGQLVLTKSRNSLISYIAAGVGTGAPFPIKIPHVKKEKLEEIFDENFRNDLLAMALQTCLSVLDPTAAKPPALVNVEAGKQWPVYISLYSAEGLLGGQAGSYRAVGPIEESIRQFAFQAVQAARLKINKENFKTWVIDISIPHGFHSINRPEELIPLLNGIVVEQARKRSAFHPDSWRKYPEPHQLLGAICTKLGMLPWTYATEVASIESFRTLSFNQKDPYRTLSPSKKKRKKGGDEEEDMDEGGGGGDSLGF